jgi:hypothetical protein
MRPSPSHIRGNTETAFKSAAFRSNRSARPDYRWLIKALVIQALVVQLGYRFIVIALMQSATGLCNDCHLSAAEAMGVLSDRGTLLGFAVMVGQTALSVSVYFLFRLIDRPPHPLRPLAIVLLATYLLWPLLAIFSWLDTPNLF